MLQVPLDYHRMHVRISADGRRITELGRDEPDCGRDILLCFALRLRGADIREHRCRTQSATPCPEVLGTVWKSRDLLEVIVDLAGLHVVPCTVTVPISKQSPSGNLQQRLYEPRKIPIHHSLAMPDRSLAYIVEADSVAIHGDM